MKLVIKIPEEDYNFVKKQVADGITNPLKICIANGTPLDNITDEIKALKYEHTDVSGYRWWNNAIDNALHIIRDIKADGGEE